MKLKKARGSVFAGTATQKVINTFSPESSCKRWAAIDCAVSGRISRPPRISTQPRSGGAVTHVFSAVVEPTGDYPIARTRSQIFDVENTVFCSRRPVGGARASVGNSRASHSEAATENASRLFRAQP